MSSMLQTSNNGVKAQPILVFPYKKMMPKNVFELDRKLPRVMTTHHMKTINQNFIDANPQNHQSIIDEQEGFNRESGRSQTKSK